MGCNQRMWLGDDHDSLKTTPMPNADALVGVTL